MSEWTSFSGCRSSRLSCRKNSVQNSVVSEDSITIPTTAHLTVLKDVSWVVAGRAARALFKHVKAQPMT